MRQRTSRIVTGIRRGQENRPHIYARARPSAIKSWLADVFAVGRKDSAGPAVVTALRPHGPRTTGAGDVLEIGTAGRDNLAKLECRPIAEIPLGRASGPVGFRGLEANEADGLAPDADRVAVHPD